jgi:hypothetical protein
MLYQYSDSDELRRPAPSSPSLCAVSGESHTQCSHYYSHVLHRQHTNSSLFSDFSTPLGHAVLANTPDIYVACVSASEKDAGSVFQDGVAMLRFQKFAVKDSRSCASGAAFAPTMSQNANMPSTTAPLSHSATVGPAPPTATSI